MVQILSTVVVGVSPIVINIFLIQSYPVITVKDLEKESERKEAGDGHTFCGLGQLSFTYTCVFCICNEKGDEDEKIIQHGVQVQMKSEEKKKKMRSRSRRKTETHHHHH
jgi:hypothetical protein